MVFLQFGFIWLQFVSDFELRISNLQLTLPLLSPAQITPAALLQIPRSERSSAGIIEHWQTRAHINQEVEWVGEIIQEGCHAVCGAR